jgi:DNA polymerase-3 subunit delta
VESKPIVYILHGEDEYSIAQTIQTLEGRLGDPATAALNTTRLEGAAFQPEQISMLAGTMPFLGERRLVIISNGLTKLAHKEAQERFLAELEKLPASAAVILAENSTLKPLVKKDKDGKIINVEHWMVAWANQNPDKAWVKLFGLPVGSDWNKRIQAMAAEAGGTFKTEAAQMLYFLVDGDLRLAEQEVRKLTAYVAYQRPVEAADVEALTADVNQGDIFKLVDALGGQDPRFALSMLRRLLEYQDYFSIFGMIVRQFRLLIQVSEILEQGGGKREVERMLKPTGNAFLANRLMTQARRFSFAELVRIYHRLLECDVALKTGQMSGELALEMLVVSLGES